MSTQISEKQKYINQEYKQFENITPMSPAEREEAAKWVKSGNSIMSNPNYWYGEDGWEMNFVDAMRMENDL